VLHPRVLTTEEELDAILERIKQQPNAPHIVEAVYRPEPGLEFLMLKLSDGRRLLIPREDLPELKSATDEEAMDLTIEPMGVHVWWPQLDDGIHLTEFLEHRWGNVQKRHEVAA
jgi:hypothetical protein